MAVHEEKLIRQEEALDGQKLSLKKIFKNFIPEYPTTQTRRAQRMKDMETKMLAELQKISVELNNRVGILEKWRWVIIGGSIVCGFIITKLPIWT